MELKKNPFDLYSNFAKLILGIKFFAGITLIGVGVVALIVILYLIYKIFVDFGNVQIIDELLLSSKKLIAIIASEKDVIYVSNQVVGYIFIFILLSISSRISIKISSLGFKIVDKLELKYLLEKLWSEWQKSKTNTKKTVNKLPGKNDSFK